MRATEAHFRSLADSLAQLVWVVDGAGRLVYGNPAWQSFTQIHVGASFVDSYVPALHPVDRTSWEQTWEQAVNSGEPYALERRVRFLPQASYVCQLEWGKPLLENGSRTGEWVITAMDADQNARLIVQLRRRVALKDKFLGRLAHEMRGPLAPMSNALYLLREHFNEPTIVSQSCALLARQFTQLARFIDDLFELARSQNAQIRLKRTAVDLRAAVEAAVETAQPMIAARGQRLTVVVPEQSTLVNGDDGRLAQVFINLLINAAKFTDRGGWIDISVGTESDWALVRVRDTGVGIAGDMLTRVFDPYVQAERGSDAGLGLGLALVRHLVELHGGEVDAYSEGPGQGSEFVVRLPCLGGSVDSRGPLALTDGPSVPK
ncbi:MAG TPA: ATP-binding protein [Steroidobacteraceae bacterium]